MKKIVTRFFIFCLILSLFGCSSSKNIDDIQTVFDALDNTLTVSSARLSGTIQYNTKTKQNIDYTIDFIQNGNLQVAAKIDLESQGNRIDDYLNFYIKDGKTYLNNMGTTSQSVVENIGIDPTKPLSIYNPFLDLTQKELAAIFQSSEKKDNVYTLTIDSKKLATLLDGMGTLSISKAAIVATVDKDHLSNLELNISGLQAFESTSYDVDIHLTCVIENYNSLKEIQFPKDLENY